MTMPSLIANYQKKQFETGIQRIASMLGQAVQKHMADEGVNSVTQTSLLYNSDEDINNSAVLGGEFLDKYLKVVDKCSTYDKCFGEKYKQADGSSTVTSIFKAYDTISGAGPDACRILVDGSSICVYAGWDSWPVSINVDLNGPKNPNRKGYDLFNFSVYHDGSVSEVPPACRKDNTLCDFHMDLESRAQNCSDYYVGSGYGTGCFTYLQQNGFKIDY